MSHMCKWCQSPSDRAGGLCKIKEPSSEMQHTTDHQITRSLRAVGPGLVLHLKTGTLAKSLLPSFSGMSGFDGE